MDIWLQSYEEFVIAKNNIKQRNLNTVFANISKPMLPTSDSFLLIMSHILSWDILFSAEQDLRERSKYLKWVYCHMGSIIETLFSQLCYVSQFSNPHYSLYGFLLQDSINIIFWWIHNIAFVKDPVRIES